MKDNFYKLLIEESPTGYAYHRIICDKDGNPCDYEILEANAAFESLTGLKGSDLIGKRISEIIPNIARDEFDWIKRYGEIGIHGGREAMSTDAAIEEIRRNAGTQFDLRLQSYLSRKF